MSEDDGRVVSNFIVQALNNHPITIYGDGKQTRSFCYVDDLISGLIKLFDQPEVTTPINLGNPVAINMKDLANEIISYTKSDSKIVFKDLPQDDPIDRLPDISNARKILNWEPLIDREMGLNKTIEYFKNILRAKSNG
jgi:UDP-glucuronate decarboxylase